MRFGLDFGAGYSAGLFIDQRANRTFVRSGSPRRLLNTFAYTCSFSVAGALAGAGKRSASTFPRNPSIAGGRILPSTISTPPRNASTRTMCSTCCPGSRAKTKPSTRSSSTRPPFRAATRGGASRWKRTSKPCSSRRSNWPPPRARVLVSTNCTRLPRRAIENVARFALKATRRAAEFHTEPPLPDIPPDAAAQTLWLVLKS